MEIYDRFPVPSVKIYSLGTKERTALSCISLIKTIKQAFFTHRFQCFCSCQYVSSCASLPLICITEQKDKTEPFDVEEVVQEMPRDQRQTLWGKLASLLQDVLQELPPERWDRGREEGMEEESAVDPVSLHYIILTVLACSVGTLHNCCFHMICMCYLYSLFLQKHVMAVVDGVTLVAAVSLNVLQDGDTYTALLEIAHRLHGRCLVNLSLY